MSYGATVREELRGPTRELRHAIPQVYEGYRQLHDAALAGGALSAGTKELIALAIAVSKECDGCIAAHEPRRLCLISEARYLRVHGAHPADAAAAICLCNGHIQREFRESPRAEIAHEPLSQRSGTAAAKYSYALGIPLIVRHRLF